MWPSLNNAAFNSIESPLTDYTQPKSFKFTAQDSVSDVSEHSHTSGASACVDIHPATNGMPPTDAQLSELDDLRAHIVEERKIEMQRAREKALFGQMAKELENKLARRCIPELGNNVRYTSNMSLSKVKFLVAAAENREYYFAPHPKAAHCWRPNPVDIQLNGHKSIAQLFASYLEAYPYLEMGVKLLHSIGNDWRHLIKEPVTAEDLQQLVDKEFGTRRQYEPVQQVLDCLIRLSSEMNEGLFVNMWRSVF